jgi:hypothetical protein
VATRFVPAQRVPFGKHIESVHAGPR